MTLRLILVVPESVVSSHASRTRVLQRFPQTVPLAV
jgi:hypothetical protein